MKRMVAMIAPALLLAGVAANAYTFSDAKIEQWVGSGQKSAVVVVDFGAKSYAFGVRWDGSDISGRQALTAIDNATSLDSEVGAWGLTSGISYDGHSLSYDTYNYDPNAYWWEYWNSNDGQNWTSSWVGCNDRTLTDGSWDGWGWSPPWPQKGNSPATPLVPEPSSILALCSMIGLAGSTKFMRLRRK